jgi:hypothetical protein
MLGGRMMTLLPLKEAKIGSAALLHSQAVIARPLCGLQAGNYTIQRYRCCTPQARKIIICLGTVQGCTQRYRCCTAGSHNYNLPRYSTRHLPHSLYVYAVPSA